MEGAIFSNSVENSIRKCPKEEEESKKRKVSKTFLGKYHTTHSKSQVVLELESSRSEVVILVGTFNKILVRSFQVLISNLTCKKSKNLIFKPTIVEIDSFVG